jgi:hypothetical protein
VSDTSSEDDVEWREMLMAMVTELIQKDPCRRKCLVGKAAVLEQFVRTRVQFTPAEKCATVITALAILNSSDAALPTRSRSAGLRRRFNYYVPFVGCVCRETFQNCFNVSSATITRYKARICRGKAITH